MHWKKIKQDGRLAPAYFSPNYKYFDQLLQTVKNKTTVLILVFKEFLQTSIWPPISGLYAKGYHNYPLKNFRFTVPKKFVEEPFYAVFQKILVAKKFMDKKAGGVSRFPVENFLSHSAENFRRGILYCCINFGYRKSLEKRGGGGVSRFSFENFLSHSAESFPRGILCCCILFWVLKKFGEEGGGPRFSFENFLSHSAESFPRGILCCCILFGYRKSLGKRGGDQDFPSKIFCLTVPKVFVGESFAVALISGTEKVCRRGVGVSWFYVKIFLSHSAENFRRGILYCCISLGYWKSLEKRGGGWGEYQDFPWKIFCLTVLKISVRESSIVAIISGTEKVWRREGRSIKIFRRKFFVSQCRKMP